MQSYNVEDNLKLLIFSLEIIILELTQYPAYLKHTRMAYFLQAGDMGKPCKEGRGGLWLTFLTP